LRRLAIAGGLVAAMILTQPQAVRAQGTTTAIGYVLDELGSPVADVQVLLQYKGHIPQKYRTKTDKNGRFVHVNVWSGPYDITLKKEGLGEVTMKDYPIRDVGDTEKPPTFRLAAKKQAPAAPAAAAGPAATAAAAAAATAGNLAGEMKRGARPSAPAGSTRPPPSSRAWRCRPPTSRRFTTTWASSTGRRAMRSGRKRSFAGPSSSTRDSPTPTPP
jgi:hypothetical protein